MSQKYIILCLIFQLLVEINCQMKMQRSRHTATFINNKLYIWGGYHFNSSIELKDFFYLDVSVPFNTQNLSWQSSINTVPVLSGAVSVKGGVDNNILFLYGGEPDDSTTAALVYTFDTQINVWSTPKITGTDPIRKKNLMGIIDYNGRMYLFGGIDIISVNSVNDMLILNTINLNWEKGSLVGAPTPRHNYAVLLSNNNLIYIGGYNKYSNTYMRISLNQAYIYNTINDSWETKQTTGNVPSARDGHSAVLGLDGQRAIIFGGSNDGEIPPEDSLYILNLSNFEWSIPKTSEQIPKSRSFHKANVIGKYMVISFGSIEGDGSNQSKQSDILLLDISNNDEYIWTNNFEPSSPPPSSSSPQSPPPPPSSSPQSPPPSSSPKSPPPTSSPQLPPQLPPPSLPSPQSSPPTTTSVSSLSSNIKSAMIGTAIGSSVGGFLLAAICFLLCKRHKHKQRQKNSIQIPGSEGNYQYQENLVIPNRRNTYNQGREQETLQIPEIPIYNNMYNHGQEAIPISNNEKLSLKNIDDDVLQHLKNEMFQTFKQEITQNLRQEILQNNKHASSSNVTKNNDK